ncbi:Protein CBR-UCR-2.3 [Caenorhabditis briggsae]|uniref:Protein CBR-UCR-2.3 n=3 Tax=Caenorhabditis briggsae TaxID=6238 RepID=A8XTN0_CAEBR|nr:Protein CBR-UCR-2.3 [Caenorhabditis briggsae]ULT92259.1 hypothetical protein L3Y34_009782 [Caenorhabditis briggsae]CAP36006.2 Protein CBR-UCR-2.3 [Caenorhabditis briggsae]
MRASAVSKSAAAALKTNGGPVAPIKEKLKNGLTVVAQDNNGAVSQLILAFRAGSRYQSVTQQGLVHHIRNFVGRDAQSYPGLQLVWQTGVVGGQMTSFASRDIFGVQISVPREESAYALSILGHVASKPAFKPWEIEDVLPTIRADIAHKSIYTQLFEDLHKAAFRNDSLAYSIYSSKKQVGAFGSEELSKFAAKHFVTGNGCLVGINVDGEILKSYGEESGTISEGQSVHNHMEPFRGGDYRRFARGDTVHIMISGAGSPLSELRQLASQYVFLAHIGRTSPLKFASVPGTMSGMGMAGLPSSFAGSAFQAPYDGTGLAGVYMVSDASHSDLAVRAAVKALRQTKVQDLEGCKRRAISELLFSMENSTHLAYEHATNALYKGPDASTLIAEIQKITDSDIEKYVKFTFEHLAIAAHGNHFKVPYSDEIHQIA